MDGQPSFPKPMQMCQSTPPTSGKKSATQSIWRLLPLTVGLLSACSAETNDRIWHNLDPLGYAREHDTPYLYRETKPTNKRYLLDPDEGAVGRAYNRSPTP